MIDPLSEEERHARWHHATKDLPCLSCIAPNGWVWTDAETEMLRAACAARFGESLRTEALFCIAATGIRIYLQRKYEEECPV